MSIESLKNRINKRLEIEKYKKDFADIGSFIKEKRKEMKVTQDEISTGICSISYLSKIENNQIVPNDFYVREIMEKLDVDKAVYAKSIKEKEYLDKMITSYFYMDQDGIREVYNEIKDIEHNLVINLCKLGYQVYFAIDDNSQYVMMLEHLVNNMSNFEIKVYLFFATIYFVENEKYKTALELILLSEKLNSGNERLNGMFFEISYYVKQRLHIKNCSNEDYFNAVGIFSKYHNVNRIVYIALNKAGYLKNENPEKALDILETLTKDFLSDELMDLYYYTLADVLYKLKRYNESTLALKNITEVSGYYLRKMILLLNICIKADDCDMIAEIKSILSSYHPNKKEMKSKVYYHYLTITDDSSRKEYLRDIAIPFSIQVEDYDRLKVYTDSVMEICTSNSRYKEAIQYYKKYQKEISRIQKLLY